MVFSEPVSDFATGDVTLERHGAGRRPARVTGSGDHLYNVAVSGMTGSGTVVATIAAGMAHDAAGNANTASTSTDNTVTYDVTPPTVTINQAAGAGRPDERFADQLHGGLQRAGERLCHRRRDASAARPGQRRPARSTGSGDDLSTWPSAA